jgi:hypothetical protein
LQFSTSEIAFLQQSRNRALQDRVVRCLGFLTDLVQRYTGSMFLVRIPDEEEALAFALDALACTGAFEACMRVGLDAYRRIHALAAEQGLSPHVTELARSTADDLLEMWSYATSQPGYRLDDTGDRPATHRTETQAAG